MVLLTILLTADIGTAQAQQVALKTNLLYDATTTPNIGAEMGIGKKSTVQLFYGLNPWKFGSGDDKKYAKHWILNPEYRYWFCQRFNGSFVGIHAFGGEYDAANVNLLFWGMSEVVSVTVTSGCSPAIGTSRLPSVSVLPTSTTASSSVVSVAQRLTTVIRFM